MSVLKQSTAYTRMFMLVQSSDHVSALTGASPTVTLSKAGGTFAAAGGTVTEVSSGWYKIALTTTDTNTLGELAYHVTAASADPTDFVDQVTVNILGDTLPATTTSNIKKNSSSRLTLTMTDSTNHNPVTGKTVVGSVSIDGGAFVALTNTPATELSNGNYTIALAAADTNGNSIMYRFSATGCDDLNIFTFTQP